MTVANNRMSASVESCQEFYELRLWLNFQKNFLSVHNVEPVMFYRIHPIYPILLYQKGFS